jgi:hypothetical protein
MDTTATIQGAPDNIAQTSVLGGYYIFPAT